MYEDLISSNAVNTETSCKPHQHFIRLKYDTWMRQFSLTFRALALNAENSGADAVCAFMVRNEIAWYNDGLTDNTTHPELKPHRGVIYQKSVWVIDGVDVSACTFQIHARKNVNKIVVLGIDDDSYRLLPQI